MPIDADGWIYINCLWVAGSLKGHGHSGNLLSECIRDAKEQGRKGICILSAEGRKREFLADPKFLSYKGFEVTDISDCGINLMALPFEENAELPKFKECAKHPAVDEDVRALLHRSMPVYMLLGSAGAANGGRAQYSIQNDSYHR